jgi:L-fuconolactonase
MTTIDARVEEILEPELPIVDPHHHLWEWPPSLVATLPPPQHPFETVFRRSTRYLLDELLTDLRTGHNVRATVFVQCGAMYRADAAPAFKPVGETEFVNGIAAMCASGSYGDVRVAAGIVGHVDLTLGAVVSDVLEAHLRAGGDRFRGIRHSASYDENPKVLGPLSRTPPGLYESTAFREGYAQLAKFNLSFDAWLLEPQLPQLIELVRRLPQVPVILDHVGTPLGIATYEGKREARFPLWRDNIRTLAQLPNVCLKLGGLAMPFCNFPSFMQSPPASSAQLAREWKPYIETCIDAFGVNRCMFESNFPVDKGSCTYPVLWNALKLVAREYSPAEKSALFSETAKRVYRLKGL